MAALNHIIIPAKDKDASATFLAEMLGVPAGAAMGAVSSGADQQRRHPRLRRLRKDVRTQHYAFLVDDAEFDASFARIQKAGVTYWADPHKRQTGRDQPSLGRPRRLLRGPQRRICSSFDHQAVRRSRRPLRSGGGSPPLLRSRNAVPPRARERYLALRPRRAMRDGNHPHLGGLAGGDEGRHGRQSRRSRPDRPAFWGGGRRSCCRWCPARLGARPAAAGPACWRSLSGVGRPTLLSVGAGLIFKRPWRTPAPSPKGCCRSPRRYGSDHAGGEAAAIAQGRHRR